MDPLYEPALIARFKRVSLLASVFVVVLGALVLVGWTLDLELLKSVSPDLVAMNPGGTAIAFMLAGAALWLLHPEDAGRRRRIGGRIAAALVVLLAVARLVGYWWGWDNGPDRWLFADKLEDYPVPNRMAPNTAINFLLVGAALWLLDVRVRERFWPAELLSLGATLIALLAIIGYAFTASTLTGIESFIPMALNTAVGFAVVAVGTLCVRCVYDRRGD